MNDRVPNITVFFEDDLIDRFSLSERRDEYYN